jgi:transposase
MVEGRSAEALGAFANALREHGAEPSQIEAIAMDMSPAYVKGATQYFPQAKIVFDKFHLMVLAAAKHWMRCAGSFSVREPSSKVRCGACAATLGT